MTAPSIPRLSLAHLPTPVEPLPRLSALLGSPRLFRKRDDKTGLARGAKKTCSLEFPLAEAQVPGARILVTAGALQANCARARVHAGTPGHEVPPRFRCDSRHRV